jgi:hypothetical protein
VVAEVVHGGVSQTLFYNAYLDYYPFSPFSFRPWGVLPGDVAVDYSSAILGTVATANNSVDAIFSTLNYGLHRYSGAPRGVDIPAVGAVRRLAERVDYYIGIQSEGGMFGEDAVLIRYHILGAVVWGYRYTNQWHDDYAEDLAVDAQGNASLLVKSVLWRGEPYERRTLRLVRFSENGRLLSDAELVEDGRPFLSGLVRVNETGQRYVAVSGAVLPDAPQGVSLLARDGRERSVPVAAWPSEVEYDALFAEPDGSLLAAGSLVFEGQGFPTPYYRRAVAVRYAPNGDLDGNGCVDDADLLRRAVRVWAARRRPRRRPQRRRHSSTTPTCCRCCSRLARGVDNRLSACGVRKRSFRELRTRGAVAAPVLKSAISSRREHTPQAL